MVAGLFRYVLTYQELVDWIMTEAKAIIDGRLVGIQTTVEGT